ncbi:L,D-transpeptidase family protein [Mesorhizobium sp. CAU 1732]|uniref:L,D-transpeptidase family protein n=1 Tax=Mesorhizobium sp. CAU 1732 TaxID=3140358 RepID=UPI003260C0BA
MSLSRARILAISSTAIAALFAADMQQASAQNLFERLFRNDRRVQQEMPPPVAVERAAPAPARRAPPRITGPSYYTYKTDALVRVDFAAIKPDRTHAAGLTAPVLLDNTPVSTTRAESAVDPERQVVQLQQPSVATDAISPETDRTRVSGDLESVLNAASEAVEAAKADEIAASETAIPRVEDAKPIGVDAAQTAAPLDMDEPPSATVAASASQPLTDEQIASLQNHELLAEKEIADALVAHYSAVPELMWVSDGRANEQAAQALDVLGKAASHGLNAQDYAVAVPVGSDIAALTAFEMELSARLLRYVRDARSGRIDPNRISGYYDFAPKPLDQVAMLQSLRSTQEVAALLETQHPVDDQYKALRVELEMLRASSENDIVIAPKTLVRPGETNAEFPKILSLILQKATDEFRTVHGDALTRNLGSETYTQELVPVIKAAQTAAGVGDDGVIGARTIQALAGESKAARIEKVEIALEQIRWLPSDFTPRHVFINTPAFDATYVEDGEAKLSMRTVVGGLGTQTYFFQDEIDYVEFHPYWGVPKSILVNKYMPKLYSDPSYLDRNGFEVVNSRGQVVPSSSVNWGQYGANVPFDVRQRPGKSNALGELKIMFPNKHAIYLHDTPEKHLFGRENRALSNGCIRLEDPRGMAAAVLGWDRDRLDQRLERPHSRETLQTKVPVYVAYFTAWPDGAGEVHYFNDVYSRDEKVRAALDKVDALRSNGV